MITERENMLKALTTGDAEYLPVTVSCDPHNQPSREGMEPELKRRLGTVRWKDDSPIILARWLGLAVFVRSAPPVRGRTPSVERRSERNGNEVRTVLSAPSGELTEIRRDGSSGAASYAVKHFVETERDLEIFAEVMADEEFEFDEDAAGEVRRRVEFVGEDGITAVSVPGTPLGMMVRVFSGVEALAYMVADCPDALTETLNAMSDNYLRMFRLLEDVPVDAIWSVDDTSTTAVSPDMFSRWATGHIDRGAEEMHRQGKLYMHHSCGLIHDLLDIYRSTKMDIVQALCPPPVGDAPLDDARRRLLPDIAVMTAMPQMRIRPFEPDAVRASLDELFAAAAPGDGMVFQLGSEQDRTIDDMRFVVKECNTRRALPLKG